MSDQDEKPILDEQAFHRLLEASYVLQQHSRKRRDLEEIMRAELQREQEAARQAPLQKTKSEGTEQEQERNGDYILTLAEIVEAQRQIQTRNLDLDKAMQVVAESVARIAHANGAAVGILDGKKVRYRAGIGDAALTPGTEVPLKQAICAASVRTGQAIRCEDVNTEVLFDPEPCRQRGIASLVAVPVYQDGGIVGGLELYFDKLHGFAEQDIHTCQLMAGLVTEALARDAERALKNSMAAERSSMLAEIQKLQPASAAVVKNERFATREGLAVAPAPEKSSCSFCSNPLQADELFCGRCGTARVAQTPAYDATAAHSANGNGSPLTMQAAAAHDQEIHFEDRSAEEFAAQSREGHGDPTDSPMYRSQQENHLHENSGDAETIEESPEDIEAESLALVKSDSEDEAMIWTSAAKARNFLETLAGPQSPGALARFWNSRRGDFYLAIALILVLGVLRWGIWSEPSTVAGGNTTTTGRAAARRKPAPDANLSTFDKLLVDLGIAEAPEAPEYHGNPDTEVWVDLHTALYYCPGSDLYGKTAKGKMSTQRDAQLDQFEPAYRKACD